MDALAASTLASGNEREHLERAHHEICTALTVFRSNVELVRIQLRDAPLPEGGIPIHAHLDELEGAVERLLDIAHEMKRWHDGIAPGPPPMEAAKQGERPAEYAL
jgi:hypothetical protein